MKPAAIVLLLVAATSNSSHSRYERKVSVAPAGSGQPAQTCLALAPDVFAHAAPGLADLRLYRGAGETPYVIRLAAPAGVVATSIAPLNLGVGGHAGRTVFDAAMPQGHYSDIEMAVAGHDFLATVTVSGSHTQGGGAETMLGAYTIFDLTRQKLGRSTVLHLPASDFAYLHFVMAGPLTPESITGLTVVQQPPGRPLYRMVARASYPAKGAATDRTTVYEFTVPAHVPVDRIAFVPAAEPAAFSRDVSVIVTPVEPPAYTADADGAEADRRVSAGGNLLRVHRVEDGLRLDEERLAIDAPRADFDTPARWAVTIHNGDDAPLPLVAVELQMQQRDLCFEAAAGASYMLFYGDPALSPPQYDYATLFVPQPAAAQAVSGPEQRNPGYQPRADERPFTEKHPALLWGALVGVIVLLGGIALRSARGAGSGDAS